MTTYRYVESVLIVLVLTVVGILAWASFNPSWSAQVLEAGRIQERLRSRFVELDRELAFLEMLEEKGVQKEAGHISLLTMAVQRADSLLVDCRSEHKSLAKKVARLQSDSSSKSGSDAKLVEGLVQFSSTGGDRIADYEKRMAAVCRKIKQQVSDRLLQSLRIAGVISHWSQLAN